MSHTRHGCFTFFVSGQRDSNTRPPGPKPGTLPTALYPVCRKALQRYDFFSNQPRNTTEKEYKKSVPPKWHAHSLSYSEIMNYFRVTTARRLSGNGVTSLIPPTAFTSILSRFTPRRTSSSATALARASDSFWL